MTRKMIAIFRHPEGHWSNADGTRQYHGESAKVLDMLFPDIPEKLNNTHLRGACRAENDGEYHA